MLTQKKLAAVLSAHAPDLVRASMVIDKVFPIMPGTTDNPSTKNGVSSASTGSLHMDHTGATEK